jgi:hypothetical protein
MTATESRPSGSVDMPFPRTAAATAHLVHLGSCCASTACSSSLLVLTYVAELALGCIACPPRCRLQGGSVLWQVGGCRAVWCPATPQPGPPNPGGHARQCCKLLQLLVYHCRITSSVHAKHPDSCHLTNTPRCCLQRGREPCWRLCSHCSQCLQLASTLRWAESRFGSHQGRESCCCSKATHIHEQRRCLRQPLLIRQT